MGVGSTRAVVVTMLLLTTMSVSVTVFSPTFLVAKYVKVVYSVVVMGVGWLV